MDVYYSPEKFNLEIVTEIDYSSGYYEYDLRVVWRDLHTGDLYTGRDAGCSCYSPFMGCGRDGIVKLDHISEIQNEIDCELMSDYKNISQADALKFLGDVRVAINA